MRRIKYGRLYWMPLEAADIDRFFLVRVLRKLGIMYIPWTLGRYRELYLREDRSQYSRRLINACRRLGVVTYVVQEGPIYHPHQAKWSHLPLYADNFLCPPSDYEMWVKEGMPKDKIKTYEPQKNKESYKGVFFLEALTVWDECKDLAVNRRNAAILKAVYDHLHDDYVFWVGAKNSRLIKPFIPKHRIIEGDVLDVIKKYSFFRCFEGSPAIELSAKEKKPCQALPLENVPDRQENKVCSEKQGVAFLSTFVPWDDLGFTWRKDYLNVRVFRSLAELDGKNVLIKPHQAHADLIEPFLPPDQIVWNDAESLIKQYDTIYCYWDSSVRRDCEMLGKIPRLIGAGEI